MKRYEYSQTQPVYSIGVPFLKETKHRQVLWNEDLDFLHYSHARGRSWCRVSDILFGRHREDDRGRFNEGCKYRGGMNAWNGAISHYTLTLRSREYCNRKLKWTTRKTQFLNILYTLGKYLLDPETSLLYFWILRRPSTMFLTNFHILQINVVLMKEINSENS